MKNKKSFAILGSSNFGLTVAKTLLEENQNVTVFDNNKERLELHLSELENIEAIIIDSTNKMALQQNGIGIYDGVIVAFSDNQEESLTTVLNLIDLKTNNLIVKAKDLNHKRILLALGLNENQIIIPDRLAGKYAAIRSIFDVNINIDLEGIDDEYISTTLELTNESLFNLEIKDTELISTKNFRIIQIKRKNKIILPELNTELLQGDEIFIFVKVDKINYFAKIITG